jgi:hypothetical protein
MGRNVGNNLGRRVVGGGFISKRHIPLKRLPYNGLLFKYMILASKPAILDDVRRRKDLIAQLLNAIYFDSITYNADTDTYIICASRGRPKMKYYYTSPIASVGVAGWGHLYNVEICCRIRREVDLGYLKGGTHYNDDIETDLQTITQRGSKLRAHPDFDYLRLKNCHRIQQGSCGQNGANNDVCLVNHPHIIDNEISGIYCLAGQDSLISFNNNENRDNLYSPLEEPGLSVQTALNQIYNDIIRPILNPADPLTIPPYMYYMIYLNSILLTLESDYRLNNNEDVNAGDRGYLGFSEVTLYALGHHSLSDTQFMPNPAAINPLPVPHRSYTIQQDITGTYYGVNSDADLSFIFINFYSPMFIVELVGITTYNARFSAVSDIVLGIAPHNDNAAGIRERNIGIFVEGCENFRLHQPVYSIFHNMFISSVVFHGINPLTRQVSVTTRPGNPNPGVAAGLRDYVKDLNDMNLIELFIAKSLMFQVNHRWRNARNGRLIYLETGVFNHNGQQPSISRSIIDDYNQDMHNNNVAVYNMAPVDQVTFIIPGYRQLLTRKNGTINSPLFKLRHFLNLFGTPFLMLNSILTPANINSIINYIDNIPAARIIPIDNGDALAGGYRKKTRKSRINKKTTHRKRNT